MGNLIDGLQAIALVAFIIAIWAIIPILMVIIGTGLALVIAYFLIKDYKETY